MNALCDNESNEILAVVDIGSNSVRMNIYHLHLDEKTYEIISSSRAMLRLASYKSDGILTRDGEGKLFGLLREYLARANSYPADTFVAFATQSLRGIRNADAILNHIKTKLGIDIEILSGKEEARYDFIAAKNQFGKSMADHGVVIDMGGGSTELISFEKGTITNIVSLPIGAVALWKTHVSRQKQNIYPEKAAQERIKTDVSQILSSVPEYKNYGGTAYLIGGTAKTLTRFDAKISGNEKGPDGYVITKDGFHLILRTVLEDAASGGQLISSVCPDRLTSIVPGVLSYSVLFDYLGTDKSVVSLAGVREGYVTEYMNRKPATFID